MSSSSSGTGLWRHSGRSATQHGDEPAAHERGMNCEATLEEIISS
jgi:hypothetical protein